VLGGCTWLQEVKAEAELGPMRGEWRVGGPLRCAPSPHVPRVHHAPLRPHMQGLTGTPGIPQASQSKKPPTFFTRPTGRLRL